MKKRNTKRPGKVIETIFTKKGRWEIYKSKDEYGNRLISNNGNLICSNFGFNTKASAVKNMRAVQKCAL